MQYRTWKPTTTRALWLGVVHAVVDCASGFLVFYDLARGALDYGTILTLVVLYNCIAFGGQVPVGAAADRWQAYRGAAVAGALLAAGALVVAPLSVRASIVIAGLGNALFHIGAGAHVLRTSAHRATESGVFVGPGAVGLAAGILMGSHRLPARWFVVGLLLAAALALPTLVRSEVARSQEAVLPRIRSGVLLVVLLCATCLAGSVTIRSLVGGTVTGVWRGVSTDVMVLLAVAACGGKMLGGMVGDRLGWITTSVGALLASAALVSVLVHSAVAAVLGMLVFQMTMPMTLKAMHHVLPRRPGLAFGVPCLALLLGALPGFRQRPLLADWVSMFVLVLASAVLVAAGLRLLARVGASAGPRPEALRAFRRAGR